MTIKKFPKCDKSTIFAIFTDFIENKKIITHKMIELKCLIVTCRLRNKIQFHLLFLNYSDTFQSENMTSSKIGLTTVFFLFFQIGLK